MYLRGKSMIYGDWSPDNLLVSADRSTVTLIDMVAVWRAEEGASHIEHGQHVGSTHFYDPEILLTQQVTFSTQRFAIACIQLFNETKGSSQWDIHTMVWEDQANHFYDAAQSRAAASGEVQSGASASGSSEDLPGFGWPTMGWPNLNLPTFNWPNFKLPTFNWPSFNLPSWPNFGWPNFL